MVKETSFFRDYNIATNKQVNEFLTEFKDLGLTLGEPLKALPGVRYFSSAGAKQIRDLQNRQSRLKQEFVSTDNVIKKNRVGKELGEVQDQLLKFYEDGSGRAFQITNSMLQGADIESITAGGIVLTSKQKNQLYKMKKNMTMIRASGVTGLIRGLQKIKQMANEKNLGWVDGTVDKINTMIARIEFQSRVDKEGKTIDYKEAISFFRI